MIPQVIIALDYPDAASALAAVDRIGNAGNWYKVGLELFVADGHRILTDLKQRNKKIFLDLKFHDIPNTASKAVLSSMKYEVDMINVHVQGGMEMMKECAAALDAFCNRNNRVRPLLIGVTLLTSLDMEYLKTFGISASDTVSYVSRLAGFAKAAGLDGVVSSAMETEAIKSSQGKSFITVTPGIRPIDSAIGDQKRVVTPADAVRLGTDYIVVGRPITGSADPKKAAEDIIKEMETAL